MRKKTKTKRETKVTKVVAERLDTNLVRNKNNKQGKRQNTKDLKVLKDQKGNYRYGREKDASFCINCV